MKDLLPLLLSEKKKGLRKSFIMHMWRLTPVITSAQKYVLSGKTLCSLKACAIVCPRVGKTHGVTLGYRAVLRACAFSAGSAVPHSLVREAERLAPGSGFTCDSPAVTCDNSVQMLLSSLLNIVESIFPLQKNQPNKSPPPKKTPRFSKHRY